MNSPQHIDLNGPWYFQVDSLDKGVSESWFAEDFDRSGWKEVNVPDHWERYNLPSYDGVGWFSTKFEYRGSQSTALFFGGVDDDADVWVNGAKVGSHAGYSEAFHFDVTQALRQGTNEVTVRVKDYAGPGGIYKPVTAIALDSVHQLLKSPYADLNARNSEEWVKDAVIYEVYLRSFSKEGSFKALEKRIPELKQLGATVVWLMPIHPVGKLNRKGKLGSPYSIQDYYGINPEFGTLEDFRSLVKTVHENGLKIIIDLVANHTSWDSKMMREHPEWFTKDSTGKFVPPNADWTDVADLNYDVPALRDYMIEMMKYWVRDVGIDGYRCDVSELVPTDFWNSARKELDTIKPVMMLSEGTLPEHHVEAFDLTYSWNLYAVLTKAVGGTTSVSVFDEMLKTESYQFPKNSLRMRFNTNHDQNAWDAPAVEKFTRAGAKTSAVLAFTFPGVPLIYNGEEVGNPKRLALFEKVDIDWNKNPDFRELYTSLCKLREENRALRRGEHQSLSNSDGEKVLSYLRTLNENKVIVVLNFSNAQRDVTVDVSETAISMMQEYFTSKQVSVAEGKLSLSLQPFEYAVLVAQ
ncbi:MAG: alpha-glucosidase C-terminal domain-containing protein [Ignavibacteriae bacterium]|nr:alpha-glucosidase C-terminal domain-containing protein [Ignavibacteriota bacterium]